MQIPAAILGSCYSPQIENVYWGPFAKNQTKHMAIIVALDSEMVSLFALSSSESSKRQYIRTDSYAVVNIDEPLQLQIFGSIKTCSFVYCGKNNLLEIPIETFISYLSDQSAFQKASLSQRFLCSLRDAIDQSNTLHPRQQRLFLQSLDRIIS